MKKRSLIKQNWNKIKNYLKVKYPWLTPGDLSYSGTSETQMLNNLQLKTGNSRKQLLDEFNIVIAVKG